MANLQELAANADVYEVLVQLMMDAGLIAAQMSCSNAHLRQAMTLDRNKKQW